MALTVEILRKICLRLEGVTEQPHFEKTSFRVNKKIVLTYDAKTNRACAMLSQAEQDVFSTYDSSIVFPVPNKWGLKGATYICLDKIEKQMLQAIVESAYNRAKGDVKGKKMVKSK